MYKENGRFKKEEKKEKGHTNGKVFICTACTYSHTVPLVEFGEDTICKKCGSIMVEKDV